MWVFQERRTGSAPYMNPKWPSAQLSNRLHEVKVLVVQLYLTLCDPVDGRLPRSSVHGILQARILEWEAISFPKGSSLHRDLNRNKLVNILWIMKEVTGKERMKARINPVGSKLA